VNCIVTAGPTFEPLDEVRRLTNFSTGRLGVELSNFLSANGHRVTLLLGEQASYGGDRVVARLERFATVEDLRARLASCAGETVDAVFHASAVGDFSVGRVLRRSESGELIEVAEGKIRSRQGTLLVELVPAPKLITRLQDWFPRAVLVGWKYEVDGDRAGAIASAERQLADNRTDIAVVNGKAYGNGFGIVTGSGRCAHVETREELFAGLELQLKRLHASKA